MHKEAVEHGGINMDRKGGIDIVVVRNCYGESNGVEKVMMIPLGILGD